MIRVGIALMVIGAFVLGVGPVERLLIRRRWIRHLAGCALWTMGAPAPAKQPDMPPMVKAIAEIAEIYDRA